MASSGAPPGQSSVSWIKYAAVAGTPLAIYLLWNGGKIDWFSQPIRETDFDSFLVAQGEHPTGLAPVRAKKKPQSKLSASERGKVSGPFETFLKVEANEVEDEEEDHRNPLDFNSFLKSACPSVKPSATPTTTAQAPTKPTGPTPDQARVLVMYGTEFGFSKEIAEKLCARLLTVGKYWPVLEDMAEHPDGLDLSKEQALLIACSTQGDGVPPAEARGMCEWLFAGKAGSLAHLNFAVIALGDKSYTHFCRCGKQIDEALQSAGAQRLAPRVDVNKEDWNAVDLWTNGVVDGLANLTLVPIGDQGEQGSHGEAKSAPVRRWGKSRPYPARVIAVEGLCAVSGKEDKNTFRVELDLGDSGLAYLPGDALGIYPTNAPQYVQELVSILGAEPTQQIPTPSWHYDSPQADGTPGKPATVTLEYALTHCYDLKTPKSELFQLLWQALPEAARQQQTAAKAFGATENGHANGHANGHGNGVALNGSPQGLVATNGAAAHVKLTNGHAAPGKGTPADTQATTLWRIVSGGATAQEEYLASGRHLVDVIKEFSEAKLNVTQVLAALRQLQPRLYSISSAPSEATTRVQATIAEVKYQALGAERIGVCSTYVSERIAVGQEVPVYIHKNPDFRLPPSPATPIIMVGPGTGLAPFRSFVLERLLQAGRIPAQGVSAPDAGPAPGEMVLFFGCRRSDQDYLYGADLERWADQGHITLHTAFSRQQAEKVYVQDRLRQQADAVWQLLDQQGAHFYVCGDAANMAGSVEAALLQTISERMPASQQGGAQGYLDAMSKAGRYQRDVWY